MVSEISQVIANFSYPTCI